MLFSIWWDICHTFYYFLKDGFLWFFEHVTSLKSLLYKSTIWAPSKAVSIACFSLCMSHTFLFLCMSHNSFWKTGHFRQYITSLWVKLPPLPQGLVLVCSLICLVMCAWLDCFGQVCFPPSVKLPTVLRGTAVGVHTVPWHDRMRARALSENVPLLICLCWCRSQSCYSSLKASECSTVFNNSLGPKLPHSQILFKFRPTGSLRGLFLFPEGSLCLIWFSLSNL